MRGLRYVLTSTRHPLDGPKLNLTTDEPQQQPETKSALSVYAPPRVYAPSEIEP